MNKRQRFLMWITRNRPMKQIDVEGRPYLQRYFMVSVFGRQIWLHRFMSEDGKEVFHDHPWSALSVVLCGRYVEELPGEWDDKYGPCIYVDFAEPGRIRKIGADWAHRIAWVEPGTWSLMIVGTRRLPAWAFYDKDGRRMWPFEKASPRDWWKRAGRRGNV